MAVALTMQGGPLTTYLAFGMRWGGEGHPAARHTAPLDTPIIDVTPVSTKSRIVSQVAPAAVVGAILTYVPGSAGTAPQLLRQPATPGSMINLLA